MASVFLNVYSPLNKYDLRLNLVYPDFSEALYVVFNLVASMAIDTGKPKTGNRVSIYLFFAYGFGTYYDSFYKDIVQLQKEYPNKADIYIVCMDALYNLK